MPDLATEKENLDKAERDIADGERRIARQAELVRRLRESGQGTRDAEALLDTLKQTLRTWQDHRDLILDAIARLEGGALGPVPGA